MTSNSFVKDSNSKTMDLFSWNFDLIEKQNLIELINDNLMGWPSIPDLLLEHVRENGNQVLGIFLKTWIRLRTSIDIAPYRICFSQNYPLTTNKIHRNSRYLNTTFILTLIHIHHFPFFTIAFLLHIFLSFIFFSLNSGQDAKPSSASLSFFFFPWLMT